jgi:predicted small lipoprotein YifL/uncharacterized protein (DUF1778 family)
MQRLFRWVSAAVALGLLVGCGGPDFRPPEDAPSEWQEAMQEEGPGGWVVWGYGTGSAPESLASGRTQADGRARTNLAERLDARLDHLAEQLIERLAGKGDRDLEKTDIKAVIKRAGEIAVNATAIERRQRDGEGVWHALARAELHPALEEAVRNRGLSPEAGERLMGAADDVLAAEGGGGDGE